MSWKLVRNYLTMHQILDFYLKTVSESSTCQSCKVLINELKIGMQISCKAPHFSFLPENVFESTKCQSWKVLVNEPKMIRVFCITIHQISAFYLKTFSDSAKCQSWQDELKMVRNHVFCNTIHQILPFYLKTFPDYI